MVSQWLPSWCQAGNKDCVILLKQVNSQYSGAQFAPSLFISYTVCDISRAFCPELLLISDPDSNSADYLCEIT